MELLGRVWKNPRNKILFSSFDVLFNHALGMFPDLDFGGGVAHLPYPFQLLRRQCVQKGTFGVRHLSREPAGGVGWGELLPPLPACWPVGFSHPH